MKQFYTALTLIAISIANSSKAQINETFESTNSLTHICWSLQNVQPTTANNEVINGSQSIATHQTNTALIQTPFLVFNTTINVSFNYKLNSRLSLNATRLLEVGIMDKENNFTSLAALPMDNSTNHNSIFSFNQTLNVTPGVGRLTLRSTTGTGDGNTYIVIDDLVVTNATLNYPGYCNTNPVAENDDLYSLYYAEVSDNVLTNDNTPEANEIYTVSLVTNVEEGTLVLNNNGSFTYTPPSGFEGGPVTFTYIINDNGYNPLNSNIATVTIHYPMNGELIVLPVKLLNFSGSVNNQRAELSWIVDANETGKEFQLERSIDGKSFSTVAVITNTIKAGKESYTSRDGVLINNTTYYRLKMVSKSGSITYSKIIVLQNASDLKANSITVLRNPVQSSIAFNYTSTETGVAIINVYNAAGLKMMSFQNTMHKGINTIDKALPSNFTNGTYIMEVIKNNERSVVKLLK
jgi:hypothetical protein